MAVLVGILAFLAIMFIPNLLRKREATAEASPIQFGGSNLTQEEVWESKTTISIAGKVASWSYAANLDPALTAAFIMVESSFNPNAVNPADPSFGLMQVTPLIARAYGGWIDEEGTEKIKDIDINLRAGTTFIKYLLDRYGLLESAVEAYNLGETKFDKGLRSPDYREKVIGWYRKFGGNV